MAEVRLEASGYHVVGLSFSGRGHPERDVRGRVPPGVGAGRPVARVDYLSTVSGGGYAGGWLAAWLKRDGEPAERRAATQPEPGHAGEGRAGVVAPLPGSGDNLSRVVDEEPAPLHHLRQYSSYLMPRPGLLTADTWTVIAIWLRNVSVNLVMMLLPLTMILVLIARIIIYWYSYVSPAAIDGDAAAYWACGVLFAVGLGSWAWPSTATPRRSGNSGR